MVGKELNIKVCNPLKLCSGLTGNYHAICHYSYNFPLLIYNSPNPKTIVHLLVWQQTNIICSALVYRRKLVNFSNLAISTVKISTFSPFFTMQKGFSNKFNKSYLVFIYNPQVNIALLRLNYFNKFLFLCVLKRFRIKIANEIAKRHW